MDDPVRPELGVDPPVSCVHTDAVGYDGICKTDSVDAVGVSRKRDAGLGITDDGTAYSLKTGAPHVVGPVEVYDQQNDRVVEDVGTLTSGLEHGNRGFLVGAEPTQEPEAFLLRYFTRGKDGAPDNDVPTLTSEMDRGDGHAMVHQPQPQMFDASSQHGREGAGTGMPNMAPAGESLALTSRADRYAVFGGERGDDLPTSPYDPQPDGPRYAAMGDAVTVNVLHWIGAKIIAEAEAHGGLHKVPST